jgi:hypothetical protein
VGGDVDANGDPGGGSCVVGLNTGVGGSGLCCEGRGEGVVRFLYFLKGAAGDRAGAKGFFDLLGE